MKRGLMVVIVVALMAFWGGVMPAFGQGGKVVLDCTNFAKTFNHQMVVNFENRTMVLVTGTSTQNFRISSFDENTVHAAGKVALADKWRVLKDRTDDKSIAAMEVAIDINRINGKAVFRLLGPLPETPKGASPAARTELEKQENWVCKKIEKAF